MQKECIEFNCPDLQSNEAFIDEKAIEESGFSLYKIYREISGREYWEYKFPFENRRLS
jgi:hypothetical protein